jgi:RNA polymerase sigma-70 factor (ECF subfamily)
MKTDKELVILAQGGCLDAFSKLVERHQRLALNVSMQIVKDFELAEDITQESFIKAFKSISNFKMQSAFKSWLYKIVINTAKNKLRHLSKKYLSLDKVEIAMNQDNDEKIEYNFLREKLELLINQLPEKQRVVLYFKVFEDYSFQEISEILDCPYDTTKANYRHGLMKIKKNFLNDVNLLSFEGFEKQSASYFIQYKLGENYEG